MIYGYCADWRLYAGCHEVVWRTAFDFIAKVEATTPAGKYPLQGDELFALVQEYDTVACADSKIEMHYRYLDIHVVLTGAEKVLYAPTDALQMVKDYRPMSDDVLYSFDSTAASMFVLKPGQFVLFFPEEGHMPRGMVGGSSVKVKKIVIKMDVALLGSPARS